MRSNHFATLTVLLFGTDLVLAQTVKESKEQLPTVHKFKKTSKEAVPFPDTWEINPSLNTMWAYRPAPVQSHNPGDVLARRTVLKTPHFLTRLAKTISFGYDPYFEKDFFEPFERRQRPVTLVAFRKSGLLPGNRGDEVKYEWRIFRMTPPSPAKTTMLPNYNRLLTKSVPFGKRMPDNTGNICKA